MNKETSHIVLCGEEQKFKELNAILSGIEEISTERIQTCDETSSRLADIKPDLIILAEQEIEQFKSFIRKKERSKISPIQIVILIRKNNTKQETAFLKAGADMVLNIKGDASYIRASLESALRNRRKFLELEQANYDSIKLFKLTRKMHATLDIEELIKLVTEETRALLDVDQVNLLLLEHDPEDSNTLYVNSDTPLKRRAVDAIISDFRNWLQNLRINENISRKAILKYIPRYKQSKEADADKLLNIVFTNYLKTKDEFIGIINFLDKTKKEFSQGEIALTSALSQQFAFSIKNILLFEALNFLARKDELTQLFNRRYFNERFNDEFLRNKRYGSFFSCIMCDLDHFKQINDLHGHLKGDEVLMTFGNCIRESIRRIDIAARYGGEEFIILLPETVAEDAVSVAERIRKSISTRDFGFAPPVTASFGVACTHNTRIENREDMISRADTALYNAKHSGRNCVILYNESMILDTPEKAKTDTE